MIDPQPYQPMLCPVCGQFEFTPLEATDLLFRECLQCSVCGWKYDHNQIRDPDLKPGQNTLSLNEYKAWFQAQRLKDPDYNFLEATYEATHTYVPSANSTRLPTRIVSTFARSAVGAMML